MYAFFRFFLISFGLAILAGCGGDGFNCTDCDGGGGEPVAAEILLLASSPQLASDADTPSRGVNLTAIARDSASNLLQGITISFTASSGAIQVTQSETDASGTATAIITTPGNPENRTITVSAISGDAGSSLDIVVSGTSLSLSGPTALVLNQTGSYTVNLTDAGGNGISGETVSVSSALNNALGSASLTTDSNGQAVIDLTANVGGNDLLTVSTLGLTTSQPVSISSDIFEFEAPLSDQEIDLGATETITVLWTKSGVPQAGQTILFAATRGTLSASSAVTGANGRATVTVSANNAGNALITATNQEQTTTSVEVEFVATIADTMDLQADPESLGPTESSVVTATVRDPQGNRVKNKIVVFNLDDVTGGEISVAQATTDSQGRARTIYTASEGTSGQDGVVISAFVEDTPLVTAQTALTVAERELFVSLSIGRNLLIFSETQYSYPWTATVTDADGIGIAGVSVEISATPNQYRAGWWEQFYDFEGKFLGWGIIVRDTCLNEDLDRDGENDVGEDVNNNGQLDPGNETSIVPSGAIITDENGNAPFQLVFGKNVGLWINVHLEAKISAVGSEDREFVDYWLNVIADDVNDEDIQPPGVIQFVPLVGGDRVTSKFGYEDPLCTNPTP